MWILQITILLTRKDILSMMEDPLNGGKDEEVSLITNPDAVQWWHSQMNNVLVLNQTDPKEGIDGWKCDGSDPYFYELIYAYGKKGHISEKDYSYMYYHDFLNYTRQVRGQDSLIVNIPVDSILGMAFFEFVPKDIVFNGWVGNKYANYFGFTESVKNMLHSAWNKYLGFT
ncbi:hypothetical protein FDP41_003333 [Naegleria fowleri]|uniref:Uncharacterized protein n=1 Tax=Naegleria fowleri TaxID=5763 RepID=A0A6A5BSM4_NAEFO|nr:uncharacterized protein FDP41_003333 [Naegleria fowleri]KAF0977341.1 hypothetical protein FDP41_003333 [Naegleria fowleri]